MFFFKKIYILMVYVVEQFMIAMLTFYLYNSGKCTCMIVYLMLL